MVAVGTMMEVHLPRYDYRCEAEGHRFELKQSFDSNPVADCPQCGSLSKRVFHVPAVVFKGSGFYVNDYGKKSSTASSSSSSNGKSSSDGDSSSSKDSTKSESKSDTGKAKASSDSSDS